MSNFDPRLIASCCLCSEGLEVEEKGKVKEPSLLFERNGPALNKGVRPLFCSKRHVILRLVSAGPCTKGELFTFIEVLLMNLLYCEGLVTFLIEVRISMVIKYIH